MFNSLKEKARPNAEKFTNIVSSVANNAATNKVVVAAKNIGSKALVNTVGIGLVLSEPLVDKAKALASRGWKHVEEAAK